MQKSQTILLVVLPLLILGLLSTGAYLLFHDSFNSSADKTAAKPAVDLSLQDIASRQSDNDSQMKVQGLQTQQQTTLPEPDDFEQYDAAVADGKLRYIDIQVGTGNSVVSGDTVHAVYKGWLTSGVLFDQSQTNDEGKIVAFNFKVGAGQVISGWDNGFLGMKQGGKRRLIIPATMGYGKAGKNPIPPNATLVFDVEVVKIDPYVQTDNSLNVTQ